MRIGVLSDCRVPTRDSGGHGLGRVVMDVAHGLAKKHDVTVFCGPGSETGTIPRVEHGDENQRAHLLAEWRADVWIDCTHNHMLSAIRPEWAVLNFMMDFECAYRPPNTISGTGVMQRRYGGEIVPVGIDAQHVPAFRVPREGFVYAAKIHANKGYDLALAFNRKYPVTFYGENFSGATVPNYRGVIENEFAFYDVLTGAKALVHPARRDAGGRVLLEAAACGCPSLVLDWYMSGNQDHVEHGVSGFICRDLNEMMDAAADVQYLDSKKMREWVLDTHSLDRMTNEIDARLNRLREGERW